MTKMKTPATNAAAGDLRNGRALRAISHPPKPIAVSPPMVTRNSMSALSTPGHTYPRGRAPVRTTTVIPEQAALLRVASAVHPVEVGPILTIEPAPLFENDVSCV